jgi:hypothetical protein
MSGKQSENDRYPKALIRSINEVALAIYERRALIGVEQAGINPGWDFFRFAYHGMFNDMLAHCMRALDKNSQSSSFWYIYRCERKAVDEYVEKANLDWSLIEAMTDKLKIVRDKTHFHIDRNAVTNPEEIWRLADIRGLQLGICLDSVLGILNALYVRQYGLPFSAPDYDGTDVVRIVRATREAGVI